MSGRFLGRGMPRDGRETLTAVLPFDEREADYLILKVKDRALLMILDVILIQLLVRTRL